MRALDAARLQRLVSGLGLAPPGDVDYAQPRLAPGQLIRGHVEAVLRDGAYRIHVGTHALEAEVQPPARLGETLQFRVLAVGQRPLLEPAREEVSQTQPERGAISGDDWSHFGASGAAEAT